MLKNRIPCKQCICPGFWVVSKRSSVFLISENDIQNFWEAGNIKKNKVLKIYGLGDFVKF